MPIIFDVECPECGKIFEVIQSPNVPEARCECGGIAKRIFTVAGPNLANQDSGWIRSVLEVVDKESKAPHVQRFLKNPTRKNYKAWMKGEGLRPLETGERHKPEPVDRSKWADILFEKHRKRKALEVRTR